MLIGYARVSTEEQTTRPQADELRAAGCGTVHHEQASGGDRQRPVLARIVAGTGPGDVLVVVRIDRLARSLAHLLDVIAALEARGAHFRSLHDPIDTASPQGKFTLQVLGAAAELERALIRERTIAGLRTARAQGRIGGNPLLKARDPAARRQVVRARDDSYVAAITARAEDWVPLVRRLRPGLPWQDVLRIVNARLPPGQQRWTLDRLTRAARRYVRDGLLEAHLLDAAPRRPGDGRLVAIVAAIAGADPGLTLRQIGDRLTALHEPTPRGRTTWQASSVRMLLERARAQGLLSPPGS